MIISFLFDAPFHLIRGPPGKILARIEPTVFDNKNLFYCCYFIGPPGPKGECEIIQVNNASNKVRTKYFIHFAAYSIFYI